MTTNSPARTGRPRSLYRAVLSLAIAALIAASIPFAAIYVSTINRAPALSALAPGSHGSVRLITTASGRQITVPAGNHHAKAIPITTRTSGASGSND